MDEIIDLNGVRNADLRGVLAFVPGNAGGVPLGYLVDFWMIRAFGYSEFIVRLPSVLFTVLTCAGVYILARQTRFRMPLMAVILYAVSPLSCDTRWRRGPTRKPRAGAYSPRSSFFR